MGCALLIANLSRCTRLRISKMIDLRNAHSKYQINSGGKHINCFRNWWPGTDLNRRRQLFTAALYVYEYTPGGDIKLISETSSFIINDLRCVRLPTVLGGADHGIMWTGIFSPTASCVVGMASFLRLLLGARSTAPTEASMRRDKSPESITTRSASITVFSAARRLTYTPQAAQPCDTSGMHDQDQVAVPWRLQ
jgi:hypothetical protein